MNWGFINKFHNALQRNKKYKYKNYLERKYKKALAWTTGLFYCSSFCPLQAASLASILAQY